MTLDRILGDTTPASGALVMGTGIVSIGLALDGRATLSRILLVIAVVMWVTVGILLAIKLSHDRQGVTREARSPAALAGSAGSAVLGAALTLQGWTGAGIVLLLVALAVWSALLPGVLRHWVLPTVGASLMVAVSTESVSVLSGEIAAAEHARWLLVVALAPFVGGLAFYALAIIRFDGRQLVVGRGDHWITGGALAISSLAAVWWGLSVAWLAVLLVAETVWPRWGYDIGRWSTVFPVGMYAAASFYAGAAVDSSAATVFARVWVWVGLAVWLLVLTAMLDRATNRRQAR